MLFILAVTTGAYTFILMAVQELPFQVLLKNARFLAALCPGQSAVILALVVAFFAVAFIDPFLFLLLFLMGGFSILQYSICWIALAPLLKYVLKREQPEEVA